MQGGRSGEEGGGAEQARSLRQAASARLAANETARISPDDVKACDQQISTYKAACDSLLLPVRPELGTCGRLLLQLTATGGGVVMAFSISLADVTACGLELLACKTTCFSRL
ncbi:hypothetical protein ACP4OV_007286 [Aristida adscensionis]